MDSILNSIKKALGLDACYGAFDQELIMHINSVLATLYQLGVGGENGFAISNESDTWSDLFPENPRLNYVKSYVYLKVKLLFDPSANSALNSSIDNQIKELEWRIRVETENEGDDSDE